MNFESNKKCTIFTKPNIMRIYNSNINDALVKDLGPFKLKSVDSSIKGHKVWEYKTASVTHVIGSQKIFGSKPKKDSLFHHN